MFHFLHKKDVAGDLPTEVKVLIVNGRTLVDSTQKRMKEKGWEVDLTCKMQLKDDCGRVQRLIKKITAGKYKQSDVEALQKAIICLQTTSNGIL